MESVGPDGPTPPDRSDDGVERAASGRHAAVGGDAAEDQPVTGIAGDAVGGSGPVGAATSGNHRTPGNRETDDREATGDAGVTEPDEPATAGIPTVPAGPEQADDPESADDPGTEVTGERVTAGILVTAGSAESSVTAEPVTPSSSLSPTDRVIPSWTDPTVRRASAVIGGPLGRHASVGRARIFTPLRVALLMGIAALICGWLFKAACIQQGSDGGLNQGGQRPWITGCYNDVVPLYGGRGLNDPNRNPYDYVWAENRPADADHSSSYTARVYRPGQVSRVDGELVANDAGTIVALTDGTLVGDPDAGYSEFENGTLVPVPADQTGTIRYLEYPVITGYFMWGVSALTSAYLSFASSTHIVPVPLDVAAYFTIGAILLGLLYLWVVACTAKIARRRIWDTAIMCLSPLLIVHAFTNWDLIAVGLTGGAMLAWARKRPVLAGILLGLGTAAKLYPVFLFGPLLVLCLRSGKVGAWTKSLVSAAVIWVAVNLPIYLLYPHAWAEFYTMNSARGPEWDSWYYLYTVLSGTDPWAAANGQSPTLLNMLSLVLFVVACAAIAWFALSARRRPRFPQLAFLVIAAFLLTNKVWSPQYSLWLVPLVALALPRWRRVLAWQFAEACVWMLLMLSFDTDTTRNLSIHPFVAAAIIRDILLVALVVRIIREIMRPELDLIRIAGDDDPAGGVLEGVPDRVTIPSLPTLVRRLAGRRRPNPEGLEDRGAGDLVAAEQSSLRG